VKGVYLTLDLSSLHTIIIIQIRSGPYEILHSGFLNSPSMDDIEFLLNESPRMVLVLRVTKTEGADTSIELNVEGADRLVISYTNPSQLNFGPQAPVTLGSMNGRLLLASLRVSVIGDYSSYQVAYTFLLGEVSE